MMPSLDFVFPVASKGLKLKMVIKHKIAFCVANFPLIQTNSIAGMVLLISSEIVIYRVSTVSIY